MNKDFDMDYWKDYTDEFIIETDPAYWIRAPYGPIEFTELLKSNGFEKEFDPNIDDFYFERIFENFDEFIRLLKDFHIETKQYELEYRMNELDEEDQREVSNFLNDEYGISWFIARDLITRDVVNGTVDEIMRFKANDPKSNFLWVHEKRKNIAEIVIKLGLA